MKNYGNSQKEQITSCSDDSRRVHMVTEQHTEERDLVTTGTKEGFALSIASLGSNKLSPLLDYLQSFFSYLL